MNEKIFLQKIKLWKMYMKFLTSRKVQVFCKNTVRALKGLTGSDGPEQSPLLPPLPPCP